MQSGWHSVWDKVVINLISQWKLPSVANLLPSKQKEIHIHYLCWKCCQYKLKLRNSSTNSDAITAGQSFNGKNNMSTQQLCFYRRILSEYNLLESSLVESPVANRCIASELCSSAPTDSWFRLMWWVWWFGVLDAMQTTTETNKMVCSHSFLCSFFFFFGRGKHIHSQMFPQLYELIQKLLKN